ncbi:MAG: DUF1015 domain-containing protein [Spirochaetes bacterium]|nr:DUF1015 domain-containing protein [Spirochaetota bacterium]
MATITEFKGLRPKKEFVAKVSALPYDVVSSDEARILAGDNKLSFYHVSKPEIDFSKGADLRNDKIFIHGRDYLKKMVNDGIYVQDETPYLYLYTQIMDGREQTGLIACVSIDDYNNKIIKKHELTREDKEIERTRHTDIINANTGQVFLFYRDNENKQSLMKKAMEIEPEYDYVSGDGVRQIIRVIRDSSVIEKFKAAFRDDVLYIADGHHRAASAVRVGLQRRNNNPGYTGVEEFNRFMAVIFPHRQLKIIAYNRIVHDLNGHTPEELIAKISERFSVEKTKNKESDAIHDIFMYLGGTWHKLNPRFDPGNDPINSLDVNILQEYILGPILGIEDPRTDKRIDFIGGKNSVEKIQKRVDSGSSMIGFSLCPTKIEQLMSVSDGDGIMPPKSTWFEPKLQSGIVLHLL